LTCPRTIYKSRRVKAKGFSFLGQQRSERNASALRFFISIKKGVQYLSFEGFSCRVTEIFAADIYYEWFRCLGTPFCKFCWFFVALLIAVDFFLQHLSVCTCQIISVYWSKLQEGIANRAVGETRILCFHL
jgi:hypothetical protein